MATSDTKSSQPADEEITIDLRDPYVAAFLAWFVPGLGHLYQRRFGKAALFMICILSTFYYGLFLGGGRVVYASMRDYDQRLAYFCQVGVGLPALPALLQTYRVNNNQPPLEFFGDHYMAPPQMMNPPDELAQWNRDPAIKFDLGTLFTMIAGLLNILAVFDAWGGPVFIVANDSTTDKKEPKTNKTNSETKGG